MLVCLGQKSFEQKNEILTALGMGILEEDERLEKEREKKRDPWRVERPTPPLLNVDECASSRTFEEEQDHEDVDSAQVVSLISRTY